MNAPFRVLIIEDSDCRPSLLEQAVKEVDVNFETVYVSDEQELSEALCETRWTLVLADYSLRRLNALKAVKSVKRVQPDVPFIFVSGTVGEDIAAAIIKAGADDLVLRDNLARLVPVIRRGLHQAETHRALRKAEEELRNREKRFRSIIESVNDIILILDSQGFVHFQSPSVERVLGYQQATFHGTNILDYVHPDDREAFHIALNARHGESTSSRCFEYRLRHKNRAWLNCQTAFVVESQTPAIQEIICSLRDVTEWKQLEQDLFRSDRLESLGSIAGGIAHDLNNLLTPILITSEMLEEQIEGDDCKDVLDGLQTSAKRAVDLVRHLLSFAQGIEKSRKPFDPADLIHDVERMLQFSFPRTIQRQVVILRGLWPISGDVTQILQVLVNLCVNARDAMPDGGRLTMTASNVVFGDYDLRGELTARPGPFVEIRITDTGSGIAPEDLKRVFDPFFSTKGRGDGTGLGLSTTQRIVRAHGGVIKIYSEIGRGTRFSVYLPASPSTQMERQPREVDLPQGNGQLILIVDDEASVREIVREALEAFGYYVVAASNGAEAIALQAECARPIELAIVDLDMPLVGGAETVRALREADPMIRIILHGGFVSESRNDFPDDIEGVLEKPYTAEQLLNIVAEALALEHTSTDRTNDGTKRFAIDH